MPEIEIDFDKFFPSELIFNSYVEILKARNYSPQAITVSERL
jgi:hypothetical protein